MYSKSKLEKYGRVKFIREKRYFKRSSFYNELYYPRINTKSISNKDNIALITTSDISESGLGFTTTLDIKIGDVLNITLKFDNISYEFIVLVKWTGYTDDCLMCGGDFCRLGSAEIKTIRSYVNKHCTD